jgi:hypothetical protein
MEDAHVPHVERAGVQRERVQAALRPLEVGALEVRPPAEQSHAGDPNLDPAA